MPGAFSGDFPGKIAVISEVPGAFFWDRDFPEKSLGGLDKSRWRILENPLGKLVRDSGKFSGSGESLGGETLGNIAQDDLGTGFPLAVFAILFCEISPGPPENAVETLPRATAAPQAERDRDR